MKVAALFVDEKGPYANDPRFDVWGISRDARNYDEKLPVIAHPPCERWGRYWFGGPSVKERKKLGDDDGCFASAYKSLCYNGGVLEHPAHSKAWDYFEIPKPKKEGWLWVPEKSMFVCQVAQGNYGHKAEKLTWLLVVGHPMYDPPELKWGRAPGRMRLDEGFHSKEERALARAGGKQPIKRLSKKDNIHTPSEFIDLLYKLATEATRKA